jgi:hypothetical protein
MAYPRAGFRVGRTPPAGRSLLARIGIPASAVALASAAKAQPDRHDFFRTLALGQSVTLRGDVGIRIKLAVLGVVDPASRPDLRPGRNVRFVAVRIRYTNVGTKRFQTIPAAEAQLVDIHGVLYDSTTMLYGGNIEPLPVLVPDLNHGLSLRPRESYTGYMGWQIPKRMRLKQFRYTLLGSIDTGAWIIRR